MHHPSKLPLAGRGASIVALLLAATGCPELNGGNDTETDGFGTDPGSSSGDPTTTTSPTTTTPTTTEPTTTSPTTTSPTTTSPTTTTDPTVDPDTGTTDPTGGGGCLQSGQYIFSLTGRTDLYGHFPFLKLWYAPGKPDETTDEVFEVEVGPDGTVTVTLLPRAPGSGEGHEGLAGLTGTIDEACDVEIVTQTEFTSDTGPFDTIDVTLTGTLTLYEPAAIAPNLSLTLEGGGIPSGPITYDAEVTGTN